VVAFTLNGAPVAVADGISLLDALREELSCRSVKDGCSPQGQCGCCTVWVDGTPRVACVTPVRRIAGRVVTTMEGASSTLRARWAAAFVQHGASQCGFCTPGIVLRLAALETAAGGVPTRRDIEAALRAHLCRCTGWQSIVEAACSALGVDGAPPPSPGDPRNPVLAAWRAQVEGPAFQTSGTEVVLGNGGFADDSAPAGARVQLGAEGALCADVRTARAATGRVQGRNSTVPLTHPVPVPPGDWALALQTSWLEPAYVEPDASWSRPGLPPASPLANGGAFGGKRHSPVPAHASALADAVGEPVRVLWRREDVVRRGPKRPPVALALRADGTGFARVGRTEGSGDLAPLLRRIGEYCPGVDVEVVDIAGPPVSPDLRAAGWAEVLAARTALRASASAPGSGAAELTIPGAGTARVAVQADAGMRGTVEVDLWAGEVLCATTLRSYALGAVHQALGMVWSEGIAVDPEGEPVDLTIRSFGILAARDMPDVSVRLHEGDGWPVNGSDAVFVATLAAAWLAEGVPARWPTRRGNLRGRAAHVARSEG
jgi:xanthine dehydrogenase small subunit